MNMIGCKLLYLKGSNPLSPSNDWLFWVFVVIKHGDIFHAFFLNLCMAGGRPMIWKDPIELGNLIADYFNENDRPTLSGLAVFLEIDRQTLYNYKERDEFFDIIKKATAKVESIYEERAIYENNPTGVIFALKNMGWTDRIANDHTTGGEKINPPIKWIDGDSE